MSVLPTLLLASAFIEFTSASVQFNFVKRATPKLPGYNLPASIPRSLSKKDAIPVDLIGDDNHLGYYINTTIGTPGQSIEIILDTGSTDVWLPAANEDVCGSELSRCQHGSYDPSSSRTYRKSNDLFAASYADGSQASGDYFTDVLRIGDTTIRNMTMGLAEETVSASTSRGSNIFGIMGVGFDDLEGSRFASATNYFAYPALLTTLKRQGLIDRMMFSLYLNNFDKNSGSIVFGGIDTSKFSGNLNMIDIVDSPRTGKKNEYRVILDHVAVFDGDDETYSVGGLGGNYLLDSGSSISALDDSLLEALVKNVGGKFYSSYGVASIPCDLKDDTRIISFGFTDKDGPELRVPLSEWVLPVPDTMTISGLDSSDCVFGAVSSRIPGLTILGDTFLRSAYVVYDLEKKQIGLAQAAASDGEPDKVKEIMSTVSIANIKGSGSVPAEISTTEKTKNAGGLSHAPSQATMALMTIGLALVSCVSGVLMVAL